MPSIHCWVNVADRNAVFDGVLFLFSILVPCLVRCLIKIVSAILAKSSLSMFARLDHATTKTKLSAFVVGPRCFCFLKREFGGFSESLFKVDLCSKAGLSTWWIANVE